MLSSEIEPTEDIGSCEILKKNSDVSEDERREAVTLPREVLHCYYRYS